MKDEEYLVHNLNKIATHLEHLNWNLGKLVAVLTKDKKLLDKINKEIKEE